MNIESLVDHLKNRDTYPGKPDDITIVQTHISVVALVDSVVYKIKKPVQFDFADFNTLEKRKYFCEEEVRLNRRLAPDVYLGVVPVCRDGDSLQMEGDGEIVEWAVKMQRLPQSATLKSRLQSGEIRATEVQRLAQRIAQFHQQARSSERIASFGRFDVVAQNARDNFEQSKKHIGQTLSETVWTGLRKQTDSLLHTLRPLIERRAERGVPCDTHGDLRLEHVYLFPEKQAPNDLVIIDCIEFNEAFRFADPVADIAFLAMDLKYHGRADLADAFTDAYFEASGDNEGRALLPFYVAYRASVRAKVRGLQLAESEIDEERKALSKTNARAHWLLALRELQPPSDRPCLVMIGGLPGSGKSTLAKALAQRDSFHVIRTDVVRKEIAKGVDANGEFGDGIYSPEWTERTYRECLKRCEDLWFEGKRAIIDAGFWQEKLRRLFLDAARAWCVPAVFLHLETSPEIVRQRLNERQGDASDADWDIYLRAKSQWQPPGPETEHVMHTIRCDTPVLKIVASASAILEDCGLMSESYVPDL